MSCSTSIDIDMMAAAKEADAKDRGSDQNSKEGEKEIYSPPISYFFISFPFSPIIWQDSTSQICRTFSEKFCETQTYFYYENFCDSFVLQIKAVLRPSEPVSTLPTPQKMKWELALLGTVCISRFMPMQLVKTVKTTRDDRLLE